MTDTDGTLEEWRDIAQKLAEQAVIAAKDIAKMMEDLRVITDQRDTLFTLCHRQHQLLVEHGILDKDEEGRMQ